MTREPAAAALLGGTGLLERAITYLLGGLHAVDPEALGRPTPCARWDLRALLGHLTDSVAALREAAEAGRVPLRPGGGRPSGDPVVGLRADAVRLLGAWTGSAGPTTVWVGGAPLSGGILASAGALEIAVHGWDVARACGRRRPLPPALAEELLELAPLLVAPRDRPGRFAAAVNPPAPATAGERLLAFLGRPAHRSIRAAPRRSPSGLESGR